LLFLLKGGTPQQRRPQVYRRTASLSRAGSMDEGGGGGGGGGLRRGGGGPDSASASRESLASNASIPLPVPVRTHSNMQVRNI